REMGEWWTKKLSKSALIEIGEVLDRDNPRTKGGGMVWGWATGTGLMGLIFMFIIVAPLIVGIFVRVLRPWLWIGSFLSAVFGIILLIFALIWVFGSPSESVRPMLSQGIIIGPWVCLAAAVVILAGGVLDGIFGLLRLVRGDRPREYAAPSY